MPIDVDDLILLFCHLSQQKEMKAAFRRHLLERVARTLLAVLQGNLPGMILRRILGGSSTGDLKPVPQILFELPPDKKKKLYDEAMVILCRFDWSDFSQLIALVMGNASLQQKLIALLRDFFSRELRAVITPSE